MCHIFFICSAESFLAIMNSTTINMGVQMPLWHAHFISFVYIPVVGSLDHIVVLLLIFWGNLHTLFHNECTNLHSHQQCAKVPFSPHPHQHLWSLVFLIMCILIGNKNEIRCLIMGLTCVSLIISDVNHFFVYLAISKSSFEKYPFSSTADKSWFIIVFCN
jgi:ABC-type arginine transport system permease subunit